MFHVNIDIVGGCNAKCPLCVTARTTFGQKLQFIPVQKFEKIIDRLFDLNLIDKQSVVGLFNWGEPILHPDLNGIVSILNDRELQVSISTNGSKKTAFTTSTALFNDFTVSVPGWSQSSYDKIHGLRFENIKSNIESTITNLRDTGWKGKITLSYHVYQFNAFDEMRMANDWCAERGVVFRPYFAYVNDYQPAKDLVKRLLPAATMEDFSKKLFLHYVDDLIGSKPESWQCPQWDQRITLTHTGDVLLCCVVPDGHPAANLGSIFDLTREQIISGKKDSKECDDCIGCGVAYWAHNVQVVEVPAVRPPPVHRPRQAWRKAAGFLKPA